MSSVRKNYRRVPRVSRFTVTAIIANNVATVVVIDDRIIRSFDPKKTRRFSRLFNFPTGTTKMDTTPADGTPPLANNTARSFTGDPRPVETLRFVLAVHEFLKLQRLVFDSFGLFEYVGGEVK